MFRFTLLAIALLALGTDARLNKKNANKKHGRDLSYYQNHQQNSWSYGYQGNWQNPNQAQYQGYTGGGDEAMENQQQAYYENQQQQYQDQQDAYQQQQEEAQEQYEDQSGSQDQDRNGQMYNGEGQYYQQGNGGDGYYGNAQGGGNYGQYQDAADRVDNSYTMYDDDVYTEGADTDLHFPNITNIDWKSMHLDMLQIHSQMEFYRLLALIFGAFVLSMALYICYLQLTISIMKDSRPSINVVEPLAPASDYSIATEKTAKSTASTKQFKATGLDF